MAERLKMYTVEIDNEKLSPVELQVLAHIACECAGVWTAGEAEDTDSLREVLDQLVLSGFLERDHDLSGWLNTWRVPDDAWDVLDLHIDMMNYVIDMVGEA